MYVPEDSEKGLYILLKSKAKVQEVGLGPFYRVTKTINLKTGEVKVFRSGKPLTEEMGKTEEKINILLKDKPELFVAGISVRYIGDVTSRNRDLNDPGERAFLKSEKEEGQINVEKLSFLLEYVKGKKLEPEITDSSEAAKIGSGIAKGLEYMHEKNIVHFDLKFENVFMLNSGEIKIADFGLSSFSGDETLPKGSPLFLAPEVGKVANQNTDTKGNDHKVKADPSSDIWSLGCILAQLTHGEDWIKWNFKLSGPNENMESVIYHGYERLGNVEYAEVGKKAIFTQRDNPKHIDHFIDQCLRVNSQERPTAKELVEMFNQIQLNS